MCRHQSSNNAAKCMLQYTDLKEQQEDLRRWYLTLCEKLSLVGRVRVAEDGVNVTVRAGL